MSSHQEYRGGKPVTRTPWWREPPHQRASGPLKAQPRHDEEPGYDVGEPERRECSRCGRKVAGVICGLGKCSYLRHLATAPAHQLSDIKRRVNGRYGR